MDRKPDDIIKTEEKIAWELHAVFDAIIDPVAMIDSEGRITNCNQAMAALLDKPINDILGQTCWNLVHRTDEPVKGCPFVKMKDSLRRESLIFQVKDRIYEITVDPIFNEAGKLSFAAHVMKDVTELKQSEAAARKSEAIYKALVQDIPGMVYWARPDWSAEIISNSVNICGYTNEELNELDENWISIIHPDDKEQVFKEGSVLPTEPKEIVQSYRIIDKHGGIRWVEDHKTSLFSENGEFFGIEGVVFDITKRKADEDELLKKEYIIESASSIIATADLEGNMTYANPAFYITWGFQDREEIIGKPFWNFWLVEEQLDEIMYYLFENGSWLGEIMAKKKDGMLFHVQVSAAIVNDREGEPIALTSTSIDITERKKAEEERERLFKELKEAWAEMKTLRGFIPICSNCKKIRDDEDYWHEIEGYIQEHSDAKFSHSICPGCVKKLYPEINMDE